MPVNTDYFALYVVLALCFPLAWLGAKATGFRFRFMFVLCLISTILGFLWETR